MQFANVIVRILAAISLFGLSIYTSAHMEQLALTFVGSPLTLVPLVVSLVLAFMGACIGWMPSDSTSTSIASGC